MLLRLESFLPVIILEYQKVLKRDNVTIVDFDYERIRAAINKAFIAVMKIECNKDDMKSMLGSIITKLKTSGRDPISLEFIQDVVESTLMTFGFNDVAKSYILYRQKSADRRKAIEEFKKDKTIEWDTRFKKYTRTYDEKLLVNELIKNSAKLILCIGDGNLNDILESFTDESNLIDALIPYFKDQYSLLTNLPNCFSEYSVDTIECKECGVSSICQKDSQQKVISYGIANDLDRNS